jgi:CheY-like chemotaxis protein
VARLLLIDDEEPTRRAVAALLAEDGHEVIAEASDGREALALLADGCEPDVIILDLQMPVMNGWEFLAALHDGADSVPPVVVFSSSDVGDESLPVFALIHKNDVEAERLWATIRSAAVSRKLPSCSPGIGRNSIA